MAARPASRGVRRDVRARAPALRSNQEPETVDEAAYRRADDGKTPKLKSTLQPAAYDIFERWAGLTAAAGAALGARTEAFTDGAGAEAADVKVAMDARKTAKAKKKKPADAGFEPVPASERVAALALLRAPGPEYEMPWRERCATCCALLALAERAADERGDGAAAAMAADVALSALSEAFLLEDSLCMDAALLAPTAPLVPVPPPLLRCQAHAEFRPFPPGDPAVAAIKKAAPRRLRLVLAGVDRLLAARDRRRPDGDDAFREYRAARRPLEGLRRRGGPGRRAGTSRRRRGSSGRRAASRRTTRRRRGSGAAASGGSRANSLRT